MNRYYLNKDAIGIFATQLRDNEAWTWEQQDATVAQFRKTLPPTNQMDDVIKLAMHAGKKMAECIRHSPYFCVRNLSAEQVEEWRRKYGVAKNRVNIMLCIAWNTLHYPHHSVSRERAIGTAAPRTAAKQMVRQFGFQAEKMARKLQKNGTEENKQYWGSVIRVVREKRRAA